MRIPKKIVGELADAAVSLFRREADDVAGAAVQAAPKARAVDLPKDFWDDYVPEAPMATNVRPEDELVGTPFKIDLEQPAYKDYAYKNVDEAVADIDEPFAIGPDGTILGQTELMTYMSQGQLKGTDWMIYGKNDAKLAKEYHEAVLADPKPPFDGNDMGAGNPAPNGDNPYTRIGDDASFPASTTGQNREAADRVNSMLREGRGADVTEKDFALAMRDREYFLEGYDLPMDNASRMARADENWPQEGMHFSRSAVDFDYPRTDYDGGFHYGSPEAAFDRAALTQGVPPVYTPNGVFGLDPGPNGLSVRHNIVNALEEIKARGDDPSDFRMDAVTGDVYPVHAERAVASDPWLGRDPRDDIYRSGTTMAVTGAIPPSPVGPRTMALRLANWNPYVAEADAGHWSARGTARTLERTDPTMAGAITQNNVYVKSLPETGVDQMFGQPIDRALGRAVDVDMEMRGMQKAFTDQGYTGVEYPNRFEGPASERSNFVFAPQQVRARMSALFDPRLRHLGHIGAGFAGAVPLAYGITPDEQ